VETVDSLRAEVDAARARVSELEARLAAVTESRSELLSSLAQEFRVPMNHILGMTEQVLETDLNLMQRDYLADLKSSAERLMSLVNDCHDWSRIQVDRLQLAPSPFQLRDTLSNTMNTLLMPAQKAGLQLGLYVAPEVPDSLLGDPGRLRQIILNLVEMAFKHAREGEIPLKVELLGESDDDVALRFSLGIQTGADSARQLQDYFNHPNVHDNGTLGLTAAVNTRLVELMGGKAAVEREGEMVRLNFEAHFKRQGESASSGGNDGRPRMPQLRGLQVLVLAPNQINRRQLERMLTSWHMKVTQACDVDEAVGLLERSNAAHPYSLVVLDSSLTSPQSFSFPQQVRTMRQVVAPRYIMLTSVGLRGDAARCREAGVSAYLTRPITQSDLFDAIVSVMDQESGSEPSAMPLITRHQLREGRKRLRVLVAEDNPVNQNVARYLLEDRGYSVRIAPNGKEALTLFEQEMFDVVLMDVEMPEMDGLEATLAMREREKDTGTHIPIIAATANNAKGDRERCLQAGMDAFVPKPLYPKELFEAIDGLVGRTAASRTLRHSQQVVVLDRIKALADSQGVEALKDTIPQFFEDVGMKLAMLREAVHHFNAEAVIRIAGELMGALEGFGASAAARMASQIVDCAGRNESDRASDLYNELQDQIDHLKPAVLKLSREGAVRILLADDDLITRTVQEDTLSSWGYEVVTAADGLEAWQILQQEDPPRLAILDWMMPGMDGVEVCREIRRRREEPYIYMLLLTTRAEKEDIIEGLDAGADDYLVKPFDPHELKVRLRAGRRIVDLQEELISARETLRTQATHDPLTGLLSRAALLEAVHGELTRVLRQQTELGIVLIDLDHFKSINDTYGHLVGDIVLREAARRMRQTVRPYDAVGRYGGEEFIVVLRGADLPGVYNQAERLRQHLERDPIQTTAGPIKVTASMGVVSSRQAPAKDADTLIRAADTALYRAKHAGRNRVETATADDFGEVMTPVGES
jgi:diguanylate cyclase (GGDEF)-like protein